MGPLKLTHDEMKSINYLLVTMSTDERSRSGLQTDTDLKMESVVFNSGAFSACLT